MSDKAGKWSGKTFGVASGIVGSLIFGLLANSYRICSATPGGPTSFVWESPTAPLLAPGHYCSFVWHGDFVAVMPWIAAVVLGALGYFIGSAVDNQKAQKGSQPPAGK